MKCPLLPSKSDSILSELSLQPNLQHPSVKLTESIEWQLFEDSFNQSVLNPREIERARKYTQKFLTFLVFVIRAIKRKLPEPDAHREYLSQHTRQIKQQRKSDSGQLYCMHASELDLNVKNNVKKRYEFCCKVMLVTTSVRATGL